MVSIKIAKTILLIFLLGDGQTDSLTEGSECQLEMSWDPRHRSAAFYRGLSANQRAMKACQRGLMAYQMSFVAYMRGLRTYKGA